MTTFWRNCLTCGDPFPTQSPSQKCCTPTCAKAWTHHRRTVEYNGRTFTCVDGEGVTHDDGTHDYVLFGVGTRTVSIQKDQPRLNLLDVFGLLWDSYLDNPNDIYAGFYLSYDFAQWFRGLPEERARMLFTSAGKAQRMPTKGTRREPFPVRYQGWEFDMLGMRRLKLRPEGWTNGYMYVCDAGPFFQTSFLKAIDPSKWPTPICTDTEYERIKDGKANRSDAQLDGDMTRYMLLENDVLARTLTHVEQGFRNIGINLKRSQFYGPGQAAQLWLHSIKAPTREHIQDATPPTVLRAARDSFYGGWFEIPRHGHIPGKVYEYDINSAYPDAIRRIPCFLHGSWKHSSTHVGSGRYTLSYIRSRGSDPFLASLPHRDRHGIISRPHVNEGWYWQFEIDAAVQAGLIDHVETLDTWTYTPCDCPPPLRRIEELYTYRLDVGKNSPEGKGARLIFNSVYGKCAQSIGNSPFANPIHASFITADCRTSILNAIATHPQGARAVRMIATDGVYFGSEHPSLPLSKTELGLWDMEVKDNMCLYMPGVYWDDTSRSAITEKDYTKLKSRGITADDLARMIDAIDDKFTSFNGVDWPKVETPIAFSVISPLLALTRNAWNTCGEIRTWQHHGASKKLSADPGNKRINTAHMQDGMWTTHPYTDRGDNHPYVKNFGMTIEALLDNDVLVTDDGDVNMELAEWMTGE